MIDNKEIIEAAQQTIRLALISIGSVSVPTAQDGFEDDDKQESYELFLKACKHHLNYLLSEGFVTLNNDVYVLRSAADLTQEVDGL